MNEAKQLRSQLRQLLPETLTNELVVELEKRLTNLVNKRMDAIEKRHKEVLGMMVRQASKRPNDMG